MTVCNPSVSSNLKVENNFVWTNNEGLVYILIYNFYLCSSTVTCVKYEYSQKEFEHIFLLW